MILAIYASLCYNRERLWEYMGAGVPRGLQNRCGGLGTSQVGSIPTYSRQNASGNLPEANFTHFENPY